MSDHDAPSAPQRVPTLTEVVVWPEPAAAVPAAPATALPTEEQLVQRILLDLQRQIDLMLDYRLREVLAPVLARAADSVIRDARGALASTLRDTVTRAVAQELARHRNR